MQLLEIIWSDIGDWGDRAQSSQGECKSVVVRVQGITVVEDVLPLQLGNSDMILGLKWLEKLGNMTVN